MKPFTTIAVVVFVILAVIHLFRFVRGLEIVVNGMSVPLWVSAVVGIVAAALALMVWKESRRA